MKNYLKLLFGAVIIIFIVPSVLALTVRVSNCSNSGGTATFYSYNQADWLRWFEYAFQSRAPGTSGELSCDGSDYCWIQCFVGGRYGANPRIKSEAKVYKGQTFYCYVTHQTATASTTKSDVCKS
jgi:hypothetical protein